MKYLPIIILALAVIGIVTYSTSDNGAVFGQFDPYFSTVSTSSITATTTAIAASSTRVLASNKDAQYREVCLRPIDYASSTVYLCLLNTSGSKCTVGSGITLSSSTAPCRQFGANYIPYFGEIRATSSVDTVVITGEY